MALNTASALKPCILKALKGASSLLTPEAHLELQQEVLQDVSIELGLTQAPFTEPLLPPPPLTPESINNDVILRLAIELHQVPFPTAFKSLCMTLASLGTANYHYLQDADYAAHHGIYDFMECAWDQLHPTQISLASYPIDIPPTPPSHSGSPFVDDDQDMVDSNSHKWMPTPHPMEKGKMHEAPPRYPLPIPCPLPCPH